MKPMCQSCGMPLQLHDEDVRGSQADGQVSNDYCRYCYQNGHFTEPDITFEQMLSKGKTAISQGQGNPLVKSLMKATYPFMLKKCRRWQK
ncbi:zinc ribbon domain-containing protein [Vaginisenegalia massiliensis]|uniref:zinc ribbon domain-containing protein n=1 Tax=Vaginisenegalia massiliensis TaxID=2058294 RepID=UPI000F541E5B|nr:zinc ribbon domain-containing protein [Vaginisenegalia massiliensis]